MLHENNRRSGDEPEKYGEGSQVLKACKPPSLVEYQYARKGGDIQVGLLEYKDKKRYEMNLAYGFIFAKRWKKQSNVLRKRG